MTPCGLSVTVEPGRERVIVRVAGEIDLASVTALQTPVTELLERGFDSVLIDLRAVSFIDSTGIHALLACRQRAHHRTVGAQFDRVRGIYDDFALQGLNSVAD